MLRGVTMRTEKLKSEVKNIISDVCSIKLFFILKNEDKTLSCKIADLDNKNTDTELKNMFIDYLKDTISNNDELSLCKLSTADERTNAVYEYDYEEFPEEIGFIRNFDINEAIKLEHFLFKEDNLSDLYGYIIYLGTMDKGLVMFKKHYPISLIKKGSFLLCKSNKRFVKFDGDDIIRINGTVQLIKVKDTLVVIDIKSFEKNFAFETLIHQRAEKTIAEIENIDLLEDIQVLKDSTEDPAYARKLSKVMDNSPIIKLNIPNEKIIKFTQTTPGLIGKFKYSEDGKKIRLDTKVSKTAFIKLLNDDFLRSELTELYYASVAKDTVSKVE